MFEEMAQKVNDLLLLDVFFVQAVIQTQALPLGADGKARYDRNALADLMVTNDGGLSPGTPCLAHRRDQEES